MSTEDRPAPHPERIRTFLAVAVGDETRRRLEQLARDLSHDLLGFKWTRPDQLHLTLAFLGDVEAARIPELAAATTEAAQAHAPFTVVWKGLGCFPKASRPNILWAGADEGAEALTTLHHSIAEALDRLGFPSDPKFTPHVTLARAKRFGRPPDLRALVDRFSAEGFGADRVSDVVLMRSDCRPSGSVYTPLASIPLGGEYNEAQSHG